MPSSCSEEHTSELQSHSHLVCRLLLEKKKNADRHQRERTAVGHALRRGRAIPPRRPSPHPARPRPRLAAGPSLSGRLFFFFFKDRRPPEAYPLPLHHPLRT